MVVPRPEAETVKLLSQLVRYLSEGVAADVCAGAEIDGETVTEAQFEVLRYIDRHEAPTVKEVAHGLNMSSAAATKAVKGLSDERAIPLVKRRRGDDRRTVHLVTTPAGRRLVECAQAEYSRRLEAVFGRMGTAERSALRHGLQGFLRAALVSSGDCDAACLRCGVDHNDDCLVFLAECRLTQGGEPVTVRC